MSAVLAAGEGQWKVDHQNGGSGEAQPSGGVVVPRDTHSIPGVSMYARQRFPGMFFKHEELVANKELFLEELNKFHTTLGTRLTKKGRKGKERAAEVKSFQESLEGIPTLGGVSIDLHLLYIEVTNRGGLEKVIKDRKWREVTSIFNFPDAITSGSYMIRKYYVGLLYYFEQACFFGKQGPLVPPYVWMPGPLKKSVYSATKAYPLSDGDPALPSIRKRKILPMQLMPAVLDPGSSVGVVAQGAIKGKFDQGYLVTVTVGTEKMQGVLYHVAPAQRPPQHADVVNYNGQTAEKKANSRAAAGDSKTGGSWRKRPRKEEILKRDPNAPRPNRTGYNFFFAEQSPKFKALHPGVAGLELSRIVGHAWNSLTEHEKVPYQEQGMQDKARYTRELQEYRKRLQQALEPVTKSVQGPDAEVEEAVVDADDDGARNNACNSIPDPVSNDTIEAVQASGGSKAIVIFKCGGSVKARSSVKEERGSGSGTKSS